MILVPAHPGLRRGTADEAGAVSEALVEHRSHPSTYLPKTQLLQTGVVRYGCAVAPETDGVDAIIEQWRRERPELDHSPVGVVGRVSRLARELEARLEIVYREHGLEPGWHDLLATLRRSGGTLRPTDLTNASMLTSSGTTKRLDKLERAGLIARSPDPVDRRGVTITLTDEGRALIDRLTEAHMANEARLLEGLTAPEREQLGGLLRKLGLTLPPR